MRFDRVPGSALTTRRRRQAARRLGTVLLAASLACLAPRPAFAWGRDGHQIIAKIARAHLTADAAAQVREILSYEPGDTMVTVASWADTVRDRESAPWHFVDFPRASRCHFIPPIDCQGGECLVGALRREEAVLADPHANAGQRYVALKYVIHLAGGDSSQPLHNTRFDVGGNTYRVLFEGRRTNLHHLWDTGLIDSYGAWRSAYVQRLVDLSFTPGIDDHDTNPVDWVERSCRITEMPGFYPPEDVPTSYAQRWESVVDEQLVVGGLHLADTLNALFP